MSTVIRNGKGEPFSKWKPAEKFEYLLQENAPNIWRACQQELEFDDDRKWRFDFAWPQVLVAVEIDGFGYGHQAQQQMAADNEKANRAIELGWRVLRFNSRQLGSKQGVVDATLQTAMLICEAKEV